MQWLVTVAQVAMTSREELSEQLAPVLFDPTQLEPLLDVIQEARESTNPSAILQPWIEREPAAVGLLDFIQPPSDRPRDNVAGSGTISMALESAMASAFVTNLNDHFLISDDRTLVMNRENPPSLAEAYRGLHQLLGLENTMTRVENFFAWNLGAYLDECETFFGNDFDMGQVAEQTERSYNTLITTLNVFRAFRGRRRDLSFTHHKEAYYSTVPDEDKERILDVAERLRLPVVDQRKLTSYTRQHGFPSGVEDILDREELIERITIRNLTSKYLFRFQDRWWSYKGTAEEIPFGADPIINTDSGELIRRGATNMELEKWVRTESPVVAPDTVVATLEVVNREQEAGPAELRELLRNTPVTTEAEVEQLGEAIAEVLAETGGEEHEGEDQPEPGHDEQAGQ